MSESEHDDGGRSTEKRRRIQRACDVCRRKKIKCDGPSMPDKICTNCKQFSYECTYVEQAKKRGPPKGYIESVENRLSRMENLLTRLAPGSDFSAELGARIDKESFDLATHRQFEPVGSSASHSHAASSSSAGQRASSLNEMTSLGSKHSPACTTTDVMRPWLDDEGDSDEEQEEVLLMKSMQRVRLEDEKGIDAGFVGKSSSFNLLLSARDYKYTAAGIKDKFDDDFMKTRRPRFWITPEWEDMAFLQKHRVAWPPEDLIADLIDLYFHHSHHMLPVVHEPTFRRDFTNRVFDRDIEFRHLCLTIFACASRFSSDPRVLVPKELLPDHLPSDFRNYSSGWLWVGEVMSAQWDWNAHPTLYDMQKMVIMTLFLLGSSHPRVSWTITGVAMKAAVDMGLHREHVVKLKPKAEGELWRRTFWCLYGMDRSTAAVLGRPLTIHDEDIDVDYPMDVDDEYWETDDPALAFQQPAGKPSRVSGFIALLKLHQINGYCLRTIYSINKAKMMLKFNSPEAQQQVVAELDSALNSWLDNIPQHLKWDPHSSNEIFMQQSALLYSFYYATQILVHRPFIPSSTRPSKVAFPSLAICTNAARSGAHVVDVARHRPRFRGSEVSLAMQAWTFSIVLLINIWGGKKGGSLGDPAIARSDVEKIKNLFSSMEKRWLMGGKCADVVSELSSHGNLPPQDPAHVVPASQKRSRDSVPAASASTSAPTPAGARTKKNVGTSKRSSADFSGQPSFMAYSAQPSPPYLASPAPSLQHSNASTSSLIPDASLDADISLGKHLPTHPQFIGAPNAGFGFPPFSAVPQSNAAGLLNQAQPQAGPSTFGQQPFVPSAAYGGIDPAQFYAFLQSQAGANGGAPAPPPVPSNGFGTLGTFGQQPTQQQHAGAFNGGALQDWMFAQSPSDWPPASDAASSSNAAPAPEAARPSAFFSTASFPMFSPVGETASPFSQMGFGGEAAAPTPSAQGGIRNAWENAPVGFEVDEWSQYLSQFGPQDGKAP